MAKGSSRTIQIKFKAKGDKELRAAINKLASATKKFESAHRRLNSSIDQGASYTKKLNMRVQRQTQIFGKNIKMTQMMGGTFAVMRNLDT